MNRISAEDFHAIVNESWKWVEIWKLRNESRISLSSSMRWIAVISTKNPVGRDTSPLLNFFGLTQTRRARRKPHRAAWSPPAIRQSPCRHSAQSPFRPRSLFPAKPPAMPLFSRTVGALISTQYGPTPPVLPLQAWDHLSPSTVSQGHNFLSRKQFVRILQNLQRGCHCFSNQTSRCPRRPLSSEISTVLWECDLHHVTRSHGDDRLEVFTCPRSCGIVRCKIGAPFWWRQIQCCSNAAFLISTDSGSHRFQRLRRSPNQQVTRCSWSSEHFPVTRVANRPLLCSSIGVE